MIRWPLLMTSTQIRKTSSTCTSFVPKTAQKENLVFSKSKCTGSSISISHELAFETSLQWLNQSGILFPTNI
jgi:hypothetical protein